MKKSRFIVAIDGFAGTGKSSISKEVARRLGFAYLNTGLLYRAVGLACLNRKVALDDHDGVTRVTQELALRLTKDAKTNEPQVCSGQQCWYATELLSEEVSIAASKVSYHEGMRRELVQVQREAFPGEGMVAEGRDMTSTIFPDANIKFFIDVPSAIRAERRAKQLQSSGNKVPPIEVIQKDIEERDYRDTHRDYGATVIPKDGTLIMNTGTFEEAVEKIVSAVKSKL